MWDSGAVSLPLEGSEVRQSSLRTHVEMFTVLWA